MEFWRFAHRKHSQSDAGMSLAFFKFERIIGWMIFIANTLPGIIFYKGQKCTLSKVGFDQKLRYILSLCLIGLQRTEHLSEAERLCNGL